MLTGKTVSQAPHQTALELYRKGNGHDRSPGYRACHRCDGHPSNDHGGGARLKVGILLVARNRRDMRALCSSSTHTAISLRRSTARSLAARAAPAHASQRGIVIV